MGLTARPELNGKVGRVLSFDEAAQRYMVELQRQSSWDEQSVKVKLKPANLTQAEAAEDCAICMCEAVRPVKLTCDHIFCSSCITCPTGSAGRGGSCRYQEGARVGLHGLPRGVPERGGADQWQGDATPAPQRTIQRLQLVYQVVGRAPTNDGVSAEHKVTSAMVGRLDEPGGGVTTRRV